MKAYPADSFVDSIGVNTHLHYDPTPYAQKFDTLILPALQELGVRHVREGAITWPGWQDDYAVKNMKKLAAAGIKLDLIVSRKSPWSPETRFDGLEALAAHLGNVASFEGVNEPDMQGDMPDWVPTTKRLQELLWKTVKGGALKAVPVLGPSLVNSGSAAKLGNLAPWCDYGNLHSYAGPGQPSGPLDNDLRTKGPSFVGRPVMVTECGYQNAVNVPASEGHRPQTEEAAGIYAPILFLEHYRRGWARSFWYEFIDQYPNPAKNEREKNFGLVRNDGSKKPAYKAIQRLIRLFSGSGEAELVDLDLSVSGPPELRYGLFQKRDGTYLLPLWRDVRVGTKVAEVRVKLPKPIQEYRVHHFAESKTLEVELGKVASRPIWDSITTFGLDKEDRLEELGHKLVPGTLQVASQGASEVVLPVHAGLVVLEF